MYKVVSPPPLVKMVGKNIKWGRREGEGKREEKKVRGKKGKTRGKRSERKGKREE